MASSRSYRNILNFNRKYDSNPYKEAGRKVSSLVDRMAGGLGPIESPGSSVARVQDREVQDYMSNLLAGQRSTLDEYVRRAAGAGIKRGGMNVAGGPALDSALHHDAVSALARGYGDRFKQAMDYGKYVKAAESDQQAARLRNLANMLGIQDRYLRGQADWENRFGDMSQPPSVSMLRAGGTAAGASGAAGNEDEALERLLMERTRGQTEMEQWRNSMEKQEYARARDKERSNEQMWRTLLDKARLAEMTGRFTAGWSTGEDTWMDRLGVELGYLKPWSRQVSMKFGR